MSPENQNPIQDEYDQELGPDFSPLAQAEHEGTADASNDDGIRDAEENPSNSWRNNVTSTGGGGRGRNTSSTAGGSPNNKAVGDNTGPFNSKLSFSSLRKKSPLITIIITLVGGGIGIGGLLSPGLLIVQMKEVMVNKFDSQFTSMTTREAKLYAQKMTGKITGGACTSVVSILCKYSSMSDKEVANFEKAGIHVVSDGDKTLFGRVKPKSFEFNGEKIAAKDFTKRMISDSDFRAAVHLSYSSKFAGFADAIWEKAATFLGISKQAADISGKTDEERLKSVQEDTKDPAPQDATTTEEWNKDNPPPPGTTEEEIAAHNTAVAEAKKAADEVAAGAAAAAKDAEKAAPGALEGSLGTVANTVSITGWLSNACGAYGAVQAVGYAAKAVRALQLARYAMIFLNVADQIKAGDAKPEDVSYLGTILTTQFLAKDKHGNLLSKKSATDSFGYQFAAYGKGGKMSNTATQFLAGGGLTGDMINITSEIDSVLGHTPKKTCKVVQNPFVNIGSLVGGIALFFVPGADIGVTAWDAAKAAAGIGLQIAMAYAPALLKDIIAGVLVDKSTVGEAAGDAITSGSSGIMSTAAKYGGNAPLTPSQAVSYNNLSNEVADQYAKEDRVTHSPLDASNSNTFLGMIVGQLIPYASNMSSLSGVFSSMASIVTGSFASLTGQTAKATSTDDYTICQDYDYRDMNLATDPYCNVTYGIPPEALNADPIVVAQKLINEGQIDSETGDPIVPSDYATFVSNCMDRTVPLGADSNGSDGSECKYSDANKDYYIHYIDQRVEAGLEGDEVNTATTPTAPAPSTNNTNIDYTDNGANVPCAAGTTGTTPTFQEGYFKDDSGHIALTYGGSVYHVTEAKIRTCQVGAAANKPINSQISASALAMLKANPKLTIVSGFRSMALQTSLWNGHPDQTWVARPGTSNHQMGLAMDLGCGSYNTISKGDSCYTWLQANASKYGFKNYPVEPWHWSVDGT
jgi:hypothetical protein